MIFLPVSYKLSLTTSITELTLDFLKAAHLRVVFKITSLEMCPTSIGAIQNVVCAYVEMLLRHYLVRCFEVAILAAKLSFRAIVGKVCIQVVLGYIFCTLVTFDSVNQAFLREMRIKVPQLSCPVAAMILHCAVNYKGLNFASKAGFFVALTPSCLQNGQAPLFFIQDSQKHFLQQLVMFGSFATFWHCLQK